MPFLKRKKKTSIQDFVRKTTATALPQAIQFFHQENHSARHHVALSDDALVNIGGGMCLFFLAGHFPDNTPASTDLMARAYRAMRKQLAQIGGNGDKAHTWWKAFNDGLIFHQDEDRLLAACQIVWEKSFTDQPFKYETALKAFGYFLQVEMDTVGDCKIV